MKLFFLLPRVPYPTEKGDKLRAFNQLKQLSKKHEIILCALNDSVLHEDAVKVLSMYAKQVYIIDMSRLSIYFHLVQTLFSDKPLQVGYYYNKKINGTIRFLIDKHKPDHIFCQLIRVAEYVKGIPIPKTLDYQEEIVVVRNGVDTTFFLPMDREKQYDLVFTGNMGYPPNINAAEFLVHKILPVVLLQRPGIRILIAGASPNLRVSVLKSENIEVSGWVPDMRECYAMAKIFIAPMQIGTGLQNKLLEAMAMQIPCITSPLANQALQAKGDEEILIADTPEEYARHILFLLDNPEKANRIARAGYDYILKNFSWEAETDKIEKLLTLK